MSPVRFEVLPSIAIRSGASGRIAPIQASKHSSKVPGSSALTTSLSVSWLGTPRANGRIERKDSRFRRAQPAISTMLSAPARQPASAISRISSSRYNTLPRCRGSSTVLKKSRTVPEALSMTPSAKEGSYESQSLPGRYPKTVTLQAIALRSGRSDLRGIPPDRYTWPVPGGRAGDRAWSGDRAASGGIARTSHIGCLVPGPGLSLFHRGAAGCDPRCPGETCGRSSQHGYSRARDDPRRRGDHPDGAQGPAGKLGLPSDLRHVDGRSDQAVDRSDPHARPDRRRLPSGRR